MKNLLLTLGHNSSAVLIEDNKVVWGYETERVTGVKSDSRFPRAVLDKYLTSKPDAAYVTHWAPDGLLSSMSSKHWDPIYLEDVPIRTLSFDRTHHDTHMAAALCYAGPSFPKDRTYGLVVDGFGTCGEHLSVYRIDPDGSSHLTSRIHGYGTSLGLWYQYATAFIGMKMHEDEYKILGYEVHVPPDLEPVIRLMANGYAENWLNEMSSSMYGSQYDPLYDLSALANVRDRIFSHLKNFCATMKVTNPGSEEGRAIVGHYVQAVLEHVVLTLIEGLNARNVILSGGVFYNVKLNKLIVDKVPGYTCVYPLAGDQGNAIGLYAMDHPEFKFPDDLNWGVRELKDVGEVQGLTICEETEEALHLIRQRLTSPGYVNLVRGSMEFGPRAMCNTSTLAMPSLQSVDAINYANERNTIMPMAPVVTGAMFRKLFDNYHKVWRSEQHMIVAFEYSEHPHNDMLGVAHEYHHPQGHCTGRPQVVAHGDKLMTTLLHYVGHPLINTSFNFHGMPIALGMESIVKNHMMQHKRDPNFTTVVIKNV